MAEGLPHVALQVRSFHPLMDALAELEHGERLWLRLEPPAAPRASWLLSFGEGTPPWLLVRLARHLEPAPLGLFAVQPGLRYAAEG